MLCLDSYYGFEIDRVRFRDMESLKVCREALWSSSDRRSGLGELEEQNHLAVEVESSLRAVVAMSQTAVVEVVGIADTAAAVVGIDNSRSFDLVVSSSFLEDSHYCCSLVVAQVDRCRCCQ